MLVELPGRLLAGGHLVAELVAVGGVERGEGGGLAPLGHHDVINGLGLVGRDSDRAGLEGEVRLAERLAGVGDVGDRRVFGCAGLESAGEEVGLPARDRRESSRRGNRRPSLP